MKTVMSIRDEVVEIAERLAARLGLNRSELYTRALECFVGEEDDVGRSAGAALIDAGVWEW